MSSFIIVVYVVIIVIIIKKLNDYIYIVYILYIWICEFGCFIRNFDYYVFYFVVLNDMKVYMIKVYRFEKKSG